MRKFRSMSLRSLPLIRFMKLWRYNAYGRAHHPQFCEACPDCPRELAIDIDPRLTGMQRLEKILHESLHIAAPGLDEEVVRRGARYQALVARSLGYTADEHEQDEQYAFPRQQRRSK
jgi:hypothetical protein